MKYAAVFGLIAASASLVWVDRAQAQQAGQEMELGSRIPRAKPADIPETARMSEADRGRATLFEFARCMMRSEPRKTEAYLAIKRDDPESNTALNKLVTEDCLRSGELKMPHMLLRGAMFRSVYLNQFNRAPTTLAPAEVDFDTYLNTPGDPSATQYRVLMEFADCVVRKDVAHSDKLIRSDAGSADENAALGALMPKLGPCMVAGAQITLNRSVISAVLSEALYREALAGQAVGAPGNR